MPGYNAARGLLRRYGIRTHFERPAVAHLSGWSLAGVSTDTGAKRLLAGAPGLASARELRAVPVVVGHGQLPQ